MLLFLTKILSAPDCTGKNIWNNNTKVCKCSNTYKDPTTNCSTCAKCNYGGTFDNGVCKDCPGRSTTGCCNSCDNPAKDPQTTCTTCLDIYADVNAKKGACYECIKGAEFVKLPASMGGSYVCTQKALVKEGKKISLIVGIIYAVITFIFVVINVLKCIKNKKMMK
ncbi:Hypothetical_protein [Hexamita inflata]|uniref:Hypothetical_protein n=1 Tax=Hexamita inflata TaxID=28002 RepID=A0AA86QDU3_9EUKA|nr:Hypothetical protein HINF_LOCUS42611 [Hexamita inflata]